MKKKQLEHFRAFRVPHKKSFKLKNFKTDIKEKPYSKEEGEVLLKEGIQLLSEIQERLYADNRHSVLIIFQASDAAGKDGAIKHVMSGLNPQGVKVHSFKSPSSNELNHDYLWRHYLALPRRGEIGIFNRSHYENILITKVHPEYILNEKIPGINSVKDIDSDFWDKRYKQIKNFEKHLYENGTTIIKFFLHVSKEEQRQRFLERIENPAKNWKFSSADISERKHWNDYQKAYESAIENTSTEHAPWFVIPANDKWYARLGIAAIIYDELSKLDLQYPVLSKAEQNKLKAIKTILNSEK